MCQMQNEQQGLMTILDNADKNSYLLIVDLKSGIQR